MIGRVLKLWRRIVRNFKKYHGKWFRVKCACLMNTGWIVWTLNTLQSERYNGSFPLTLPFFFTPVWRNKSILIQISDFCRHGASIALSIPSNTSSRHSRYLISHSFCVGSGLSPRSVPVGRVECTCCRFWTGTVPVCLWFSSASASVSPSAGSTVRNRLGMYLHLFVKLYFFS